MILSVRHVTSYSWASPMRQLVQSLRLYPSLCDSQRVIDWTVSIQGFGPGPERMARQLEEAGQGRPAQAEAASAARQMSQSLGGMSQSLAGPSQGQSQSQLQHAGPVQTLAPGASALIGAGFRDGAGDRTETVSVRGPVERVVIEVTGRIETFDTAGILKGHREQLAPGVYLRPTRATAPDLALTELSRDVVASFQGQSQLSLAHGLSAEVAERIVYTPGETGPGTTAAEALSRGKGVCQDHAHALIAAAHLAGIPARYVVGYLVGGDAQGAEPVGEEPRFGSEAGHAWAELWLDGLGWIGFDPANRCCPDPGYIRLCSGLDAQDAAPIRGVAMGAEAEELAVDVAVRRQEH